MVCSSLSLFGEMFHDGTHILNIQNTIEPHLAVCFEILVKQNHESLGCQLLRCRIAPFLECGIVEPIIISTC
jgi:hypothetical protein